MWNFVLVVLVATLLVPGEAHAWGPITHLTHGSAVLRDLTILSLSLQRLLRRHRLAYLYGCVGADITQAKKYTREQQAHCHSWPVGWSLLERARNDTQRAFAYGYLTHLAGDVFSHNHYVPTQLIVSYSARALRHVYWEARFDSMQDPWVREIIGELRRHSFPECDSLVEETVGRTLFSFRTDKRIFDGFIAVHDLGQWHRIMERLAKSSRFDLPEHLVPAYNTACHASAMDILRRGKRAECQHADPTGLDALTRAKQVRTTLKALARRRSLTPALQRSLAILNERAELGVPGPDGLRPEAVA